MSKTPHFPRFEQYSRVLPGDERIRASVLTNGSDLIDAPPDGVVTTLFEALQRATKISNNGEFVGERLGPKKRYGWLRYQEVLDRAQRIGSALIRLGLSAGDVTKIGFCSHNSIEYLIAAYGCMSYSMVIVPLYHNSKQDALCEIINHCKIELIFCDTQDRANSFLLESDNLPTLKTIIVMKAGNKLGAVNGPSTTNPNVSLFEWDYILKLGDTHMKPVTPPKPRNVYIICHTSGTTGTPKGVQLTHRGLLAAMAGLYHQWCPPPHRMLFDHRDVYFSFLPLAHIYEQLLQSFIIYAGGRIGFFSGDIKNILDDMQTLKPTLVAMVPRILNRFYDSVHANIENAGTIKKFLFRKAVTSKTNRLNRGSMTYSTIWDKLVFKKIHAMFGGRLRLITTGGAPIAPNVLRFSRLAYGCPVFEGYGQTECSAAGTLSLPFDTQGGHVGGPSSWTHVKLVDVPELGYLAADDKGEICFRGAGVMLGYYGDEALTNEAIDKDGWLHTADIGEWLPNGALRIIDRKKHFFKLSQGEFVSPETVENVYSQSPLVAQIFVDGSPIRSFLVAIVVPNIENVRALLAKQPEQNFKGLTSAPVADILTNKNVRSLILTQLRIFGAEKGLSGIEQIKNLHLTDEEFTAENGLLTLTLKMRRQQMRAKYQNVIDQLYEEEKN